MPAQSMFQAICVSRPALRVLAGGVPLHVLGTPGRSLLLGGERGDVLFVHPGDRPTSPCAICVEPVRAWDRWLRGVAAGTAVEVSRGRLAFRGSGGLVDLSGAAAWDPRVPALAPGARHRLPVLTRALATRPGDGIGPAVASPASGETLSLLTPRVRPTLARLRAAVEAASPAALVDAAAGLVGLGPGLTPSGDDFLVGFLGTLRLSDAPGAALVNAAAAPFLALAAERTTLVALSFLRHALRGEFAAPVQAVLDGLRGSTPTARFEEAVAAVLGWGHTSGADTLAGIISALRVAGAVPVPTP